MAKLFHKILLQNAPKLLASNKAGNTHTSILTSIELRLIDLTKLQESQKKTANQKIKLYY